MAVTNRKVKLRCWAGVPVPVQKSDKLFDPVGQIEIRIHLSLQPRAVTLLVLRQLVRKMADDMDYLQPSFDPNSITMPRLRNVLMTYGIQYPPSAKKFQLVEIFNQELKPKAKKLLAAQDRVRRTSKGITDMPSSQESTVNSESDDRSSMPPPPTPQQRKTRKTGRSPSEDGLLASVSTTRTSGGGRSSSKHARQSDTETEPELPKRPSVQKSRKSEAPPRVKVEDSDDVPIRPVMPESAFSDENPFQSGSSPSTMEANRRRSAGVSSERKKSSSNRRKTGSILSHNMRVEQVDGAVVPTSKTFEMPISSLKETDVKREQDDGVEAGEEFTPEEQLELVRHRAANGEKDILPPRRRRRTQESSTVPKSLPWMILAALLGGYTTWYRQEKLAVGYCGIGRSSDALSSIHIPEWASALQPTCEPCPQHAICYENMETKCEHDFLLQPHPLSLGGLVPLPPKCEPDGEKVRRVKAVADRAVEELRERKARAECGTLKDAKGRDSSAEIDEKDLKTEVGKKRRRGMTEAEFEDLWKGAIGEIIGREEVVSSSDRNRLASTSLARLPVACALRRSARLTLARYRGALSFLAFLLLLTAYVRNKIRQNRADNARVPSLVSSTLDRLATQAALYTRGDAPESWISVGQLRDDVLRDEFSDKRREAMWSRVRAVVERNANVRVSSRELRGGDVSRVWEWIGSIKLLDDPGFSSRKSGGKRVSWGGVVEDGYEENRSGIEGSAIADRRASEGGREIVEQRKWDEGRPIY
ncbi:MAG: hypothetical protein Q9217_001955 [Psora testacea]